MTATNDPRVNILIVGGTFDPPHRAHLDLARQAALKRECDEVVFIPAAVNPLKVGQPPTAGRHRVEMLRLALEDWESPPRARVSTIELDRGKGGSEPSYMVETLEEICGELRGGGEGRGVGGASETHPTVTLHFLIGADAAVEFGRWKNPQRILELARPAVVLRAPMDRASFSKIVRERWPGLAEALIDGIVELPMVDVSTTEAREAMRRGDWGAAELIIGPKVLAYCREQRLYRS